MNTKDLLEQLRVKGWGDSAIADALGMDRVTVYRWRMGLTAPQSERPVMDSLRRLLRRRGPPRRKDLAGVAPARYRSLLPAITKGGGVGILARVVGGEASTGEGA